MQISPGGGSRGRALILLIEDDPMAAETLLAVLEPAGYGVRHAVNGVEGLAMAEAEHPDLVVLDMQLPDSDGLMLIDRLRAAAGERTAILLCSGAVTQRDRTLALHLGADDVVGKPFDVDELLARVEALLRRYLPPQRTEAPVPGEPRVTRIGSLEINPARRLASVAGTALALTPTEYRLLLALASQPGSVLDREEIAERVWGQAAARHGRAIDVAVKRLRDKLEEAQGPHSQVRIITARGMGYGLDNGTVS